jgi:hypothetical protein
MRPVLAVAVVLALVGAVLVAAGFGLWAVPAGLVVAGVEAVAAGWLVAYFEAGRPRRSGGR